MTGKQLAFDFFENNSQQSQSTPVKPEPEKPSNENRAKRPSVKTRPVNYHHELRRTVIAWLLAQNPTGLAISVPTRISKFKADVAAFQSNIIRGRSRPVQTVIVEIRSDRKSCWPDCGNHDELLNSLKQKKAIKEQLEAEIRIDEPELRESDTLFDEFQSWDYSRSTSREYQQCRRQVEKLEHALYKGSRFEQLRRTHVADLHYLAVPEGLVEANEVAFGWGLLYITKDSGIKIVKEAFKRDCPPENRLHLVMNIAAAGLNDTLFSNGIRRDNSGDIIFTPIPRRRRNTLGKYKDII